MDFVPVLMLAALVKKTIDWARVVLPQELQAKFLIPLSALVGVAYSALFSLSPELAGEVKIWSEQTLADASAALVVVYGLAVGTLGSVIHDLVKPNTPPHDGT
jgi:hypothetical protein